MSMDVTSRASFVKSLPPSQAECQANQRGYLHQKPWGECLYFACAENYSVVPSLTCDAISREELHECLPDLIVPKHQDPADGACSGTSNELHNHATCTMVPRPEHSNP